ncbi:hypothetical protein Aperf_G00000000497 [Anoplocephala perfoliata]
MARWLSYPFLGNSSKLKDRKEYNTIPSILNESATLLGTVGVPRRHGNKICFYASLLIKKITETQNNKPDLVRIIVDENGITTKDKNNNIKLKCHFEDLTYVWVHPDDSRLLGIICTFRPLDVTYPVSKFIAFRMSSKVAKHFAYRLQQIYCDYMNGIRKRSEQSFAPVIMDDLLIPNSTDKSLDVGNPIRKSSAITSTEISRARFKSHYEELLARSKSSTNVLRPSEDSSHEGLRSASTSDVADEQ